MRNAWVAERVRRKRADAFLGHGFPGLKWVARILLRYLAV